MDEKVVRNGTISGFQNLSSEKRPILTGIYKFYVFFILYSEGFEKLTLLFWINFKLIEHLWTF